jgi:hypothetical protein
MRHRQKNKQERLSYDHGSTASLNTFFLFKSYGSYAGTDDDDDWNDEYKAAPSVSVLTASGRASDFNTTNVARQQIDLRALQERQNRREKE